MKDVNRICILLGNLPTTTIFALTENIAPSLEVTWVPTYPSELRESCQIELSADETLQEKRCSQMAQRIVAVKGIEQVHFKGYEITVTIGRAFRWDEGITEAIVQVLKETAFPNVENVEVIPA